MPSFHKSRILLFLSCRLVGRVDSMGPLVRRKVELVGGSMEDGTGMSSPELTPQDTWSMEEGTDVSVDDLLAPLGCR